MSTKLPPSERDFEIYDAIHIACSSTRCQAELHRISQTRVRQIVRRVVEWLGEVLPPQTKVAKEQETHLARQIAADRFQRQLEQITTFWDMTQDAKYASIRIRLTTAQARLGVVGGLIDGLAADAIEGLPVPVWTTSQAAVGWDKASPEVDGPPSPDAGSPSDPNPKSKIENPKSLFPPPDLVAKGLKALRKNMPHELSDPFRWEEITPEIVAARAAWGWPFPPVLIQNLKKCGILPSDNPPSATTPTDSPAPQSEISNLKSEIPLPPPPGDCSPSDEAPGNAQLFTDPLISINRYSPATYNHDTPRLDGQLQPETDPSNPLLTAPASLPATVLQITPNQSTPTPQ